MGLQLTEEFVYSAHVIVAICEEGDGVISSTPPASLVSSASAESTMAEADACWNHTCTVNITKDCQMLVLKVRLKLVGDKVLLPEAPFLCPNAAEHIHAHKHTSGKVHVIATLPIG